MSNLHELIYALSDALDLVGVDDVNHGKRVAYMALCCADVLQWSERDRIDLFHASLLHDCGVSSTRIHDKLVFTLDWEGAEDHCIRGYRLLGLSGRLKHLADVILFHHTHFEMLAPLHVDGRTARLANLIFLTDRVDALCAQHRTRDHATLLGAAHTVREEIRELAGTFFDPDLEVCTKIEIAGLLHDLGKLRVPDELLDKQGPLDPDEFDVVKIHAYETEQILSQISGLEEIATWAAQHHETLNGTGYPNHAVVLSTPSRIIAVADVFQALAQSRPYRRGLAPLKIMEILRGKVDDGSLDGDVVAVIEANLQSCWQIALAHSAGAEPL